MEAAAPQEDAGAALEQGHAAGRDGEGDHPRGQLDKLYQKYAKLTIELREKVNKIVKDGGHLIFADECVFKARGYQK